MRQTTTPANVLPVGDLIAHVAGSVARAQAAMDAQSIQSSRRLLEDGLTERFGLQARWYAIPEAEFELKLLLQISESNDLLAHVANAEHQARFEMAMESASQFHMKVRRLPAAEMGTPSLLSDKQVIELVSQIERVAWTLHDHPGSFLSLSFAPNAEQGGYAGGLWTVALCRPGDRVRVAALLIVDDAAVLEGEPGQERQFGQVIAARFFDDEALPESKRDDDPTG